MVRRSTCLVSLCSVLLVLGAAACQTIEEPQAADVIADGRAIAEHQCASCHAIGLHDASPNTTAPPFREIGRRYEFPVLEQELEEGIKLGHPTMPRFEFSPRGTDALLAYLRHIQVADRDARDAKGR